MKVKKAKQPPRSHKRRRRGPQSAQQTIPYREMHKDGVCRVADNFYTKTIEYEDINYAVASTEDQNVIFDGYCAFLNYFDATLPYQLSFINHRSRPESRYSVNIPPQNDNYNGIRDEFTDMLKRQIAKSNNGLVRSKYITFGIHADGIHAARPRLERVESDILSNYKKLGVEARTLDGRERLAVLHGQLHPGGRERFQFDWGMIPQTGLGTKDFIAPSSFDFRQSRLFRVGQTWGAASYMQIMASELSDKLLAELLELDMEMTVTLHIQTVDQTKAIKQIKGKISDIDKMKVEEQKKAVRSGYDMDILPPDLVTFSKDAAALLSDLQSRNERMFLLTFLVTNTANTRQQLENDLFTVAGVMQKYNCFLRRLDWQQEQGFVSSLVLGHNAIEIHRGMTTSSTAIFVPFMTRELRMGGEAIYYGMNALSHNVIMADRKKLKSANGLYLGSTGSGKSFAAKREIINVFLTTKDRILIVDPMGEYAPLVRRLGGQVIEISPDSPHHLNPMDIRFNVAAGESPLSMKADFLLSLCELVVEAAVLYAIQQQVYLAVDYSKTIERINKAPLVKSQSKKLVDAIEQKERELSKIARYKQAIYQDWKDGEITHSDYRHMKEDYERQAEDLNIVIDRLRAEQAELENGIDTENPFLAAFRQYQNIDKLTRDVLIELVDRIVIYEGGNISIVFRFADELRRIQDYIEVNTPNEAV